MAKKQKTEKEHVSVKEEQTQNKVSPAIDDIPQANSSECENTAAAKSTDTPPEDTGAVDQVHAQNLASLEARCKELQDQYLRKAADFDNYRKRMIREKQDAINFANSNLLTDLLQILDDFDRAIEAGGKHDEGTPAAAFAEGVVMIRNSMVSMLESKYDLHYYPAKDMPFNPDIHEAVATTPSKEVSEPTVGAELQKGYTLKERVLRPAKVMVLMPVKEETETT
ncbi:MAG: nucleotide exchange factor GrpE [Treponema sp.]